MSLAVVSERAPGEAGGLAVAAERIARHAQANGARVHLVTWSKQAAPGARVVTALDGITLHQVGRLPHPVDALHALTDHLSDVVRDESVNVIHSVNAVYAGYAGVVAGSLRSVRSLVSVRGNDVDRGLYRSDQLPFLTHALSRADSVTGVSSDLCDKVKRVFGRAVRYVPNSVDADAFRPETADNSLRASLNLGDDACIGFVGELREKKGIRFLLPAFAEASRLRGVRLLLIGGVRAESRAAFDEFKRNAPGAAAKVTLLDYERNPRRLSRLLALCDCLVFPSLYEGMPNAVLESMAAARPVLATDVGGHRDLIDHGKTGALLSLRDLDRLPLAMLEMVDLPRTERDRMGAAARAHVLARHQPGAEAAAYAAIYAELRQTAGEHHI